MSLTAQVKNDKSTTKLRNIRNKQDDRKMVNIITQQLASEKRRVNKLRAETMAARERWEKIVQENLCVSRAVKGQSSRSVSRVLYIALDGEWWKILKAEMNSLNAKISRATPSKTRAAPDLWLPTYAEFPTEIVLKKYQATSTRRVNRAQAISFAKKAGHPLELSKKRDFKIRAITGFSYKLRITIGDHIEYLPFTKWAVCVCRNPSSIPKLRKSRTRSSVEAESGKGKVVCLQGRSALLAVKKSKLTDKTKASAT